MHTPDLAKLHSISTSLPPNRALEQVCVDIDGTVQLVTRDEEGGLHDWRRWAPSTDAAATVHTMIQWLSHGAPGDFASFEF